MRIHTGDKPHQCSICEMSFTVSSDLTRHVNIHTGEKTHRCGICEKSFSDFISLTSYMKTHWWEIICFSYATSIIDPLVKSFINVIEWNLPFAWSNNQTIHMTSLSERNRPWLVPLRFEIRNRILVYGNVCSGLTISIIVTQHRLL